MTTQLTSKTYDTHFPKLTPEQLAENSKKKVIIGMSGGVDSSVSAFILQQQGYQVEGLFMKNWEEDDDTDYCTAAAELADAQAVADKLGMKLHKINFAAEYWDNVFEYSWQNTRQEERQIRIFCVIKRSNLKPFWNMRQKILVRIILRPGITSAVRAMIKMRNFCVA